jgi:hypothetical protein
MKLIRLAVLCFGLSSVGPPPEAGPTAVLLQVDGNVTVAEHALSGAGWPPSKRMIRKGRQLQVLRSGDALHIPQGAHVGFMCSTDRWIVLTGKTECRLDANLCARGKPFPPGTYRSLAPEAGRLRSVRGAMVLERGIRGVDSEKLTGPVLLYPRNTSILDGRPTLRWTRIEDTTEYLIDVRGDVSFQRRLDANEVPCSPSPEVDGAEVCSVPYPDSAPELPSGGGVTLSIMTRQGFSSSWRGDSSAVSVRRLPAEHAAEIRAQLDALRKIELGDFWRRLLAADLQLNEGLIADALSTYREALELQDLPEIRVTLGDVYLELGLLSLAEKSYRVASDAEGRSLRVAATAMLGFGWIESARGGFKRASQYFDAARTLYSIEGLAEEASVAEGAAAEARTKMP